MSNTASTPESSSPSLSSSRIRTFYFEDNEAAHSRFVSQGIVNQAKRRKVSSNSSSSGGINYIPPRSVKSLTEPVEFHFHTEDRAKSHFEASACSSSSSSVVPSSPFVSISQKVREFQQKTPKRFRTLPLHSRYFIRTTTMETEEELTLTVPEEVSFHTEARARSSTVLGREDREALEMQQMPKFKANPVNYKVLHGGGHLGISRVPKARLTETVEFKFETEERAKSHHLDSSTVSANSEQSFQFHALELDPEVLYGAVKLPALAPKVLTVPQSPALLTKSRSQLHASSSSAADTSVQEVFVFKAQPMPVSKPFVPNIPAPVLTVPEPFALITEQRGHQAKTRQSRRIREKKRSEKEAMMFKAQPMPIPEPFQVQPKDVPLTVPEPFNLVVEERGQMHKQQFEARLAEEQRQATEQAQFKALEYQPVAEFFEPQKSTKPLTVLSDVVLNSELRSARRAEFEQQVTVKTKMAEDFKRMRDDQEMQMERELVKEMRRNMVHKALPVAQPAPFKVKPTKQKLTTPVTPKFKTEQRSNRIAAGRDV